jgi:hypothetical protein
MCEKQKNLSEKLQLGMYTEEPLLRWLKDFLRSAAPLSSLCRRCTADSDLPQEAATALL